jgi:hypothetical protein
MNIETPWMLITGCAMLGYLLPEVLGAFGKVRVPMSMNLFSAIACGLIVGAFVV